MLPQIQKEKKKKDQGLYFPKSLDKNSGPDLFSPNWVTFPSLRPW